MALLGRDPPRVDLFGHTPPRVIRTRLGRDPPRVISSSLLRDPSVMRRSYSTRGTKSLLYYILECLTQTHRKCELAEGCIYCNATYSTPPKLAYVYLHLLAIIVLLEMYAYKIESSFLKVTIGFTMRLPNDDEVLQTLDKALSMMRRGQKKLIYDRIEGGDMPRKKYEDAEILGVCMLAYYMVKEPPVKHVFSEWGSLLPHEIVRVTPKKL